MKYRKFGRLDWRVSALGFGSTRFPIIGDDKSQIDLERTAEMLHYAIDRGLNYIDGGYDYQRGNSEKVVGEILEGGYRSRVKLATKLPCWYVKSLDDCDRYLDEQLTRLRTDHLDFYLLHGLHRQRWARMQDLGVWDWGQSAIADGRIGRLGFSFHDTLSVFKDIVDSYDGWEMCTIQYNYMNENVQAGTEGLEYAAAKGLAVAIMEPLRGGLLARPPEKVQAIWDSCSTVCQPADMGLRWLWNRPEVSVVLSGMSTLEQVQQNVESAGRSGIGSLSSEELELVSRVRDEYLATGAIPCTGCSYCMPCPNGVDIPRNFEMYNEGQVYGNWHQSGVLYRGFMPDEEKARACIGCRECEEKCPQGIEISEWMPKVHEKLGQEVS